MEQKDQLGYPLVGAQLVLIKSTLSVLTAQRSAVVKPFSHWRPMKQEVKETNPVTCQQAS